MFANVSLTWIESAGRVDNYRNNASINGLSSLNLSFSMTESRLTLDEVPYNEDVTITFSAVNCVAESEKVNISFAACTNS